METGGGTHLDVAITAAAAMCTPFDLQAGDINWRRPDAGFRRMYDFYLACESACDSHAAICFSTVHVCPPHLGFAALCLACAHAARMRSVVKANLATLAAITAQSTGQHIASRQSPPIPRRVSPRGVLPKANSATCQPQTAAQARTVREFDQAATIHWFGFNSVDEYYQQASSARVLPDVRTPLLCVQVCGVVLWRCVPNSAGVRPSCAPNSM